jgi:hypothetical protein
MSVMPINQVRRWIISSIRASAGDANRYHFLGVSDECDISASDRLEELTGQTTGAVFMIVNKRTMTGSHLEFDLERAYATSAI